MHSSSMSYYTVVANVFISTGIVKCIVAGQMLSKETLPVVFLFQKQTMTSGFSLTKKLLLSLPASNLSGVGFET